MSKRAKVRVLRAFEQRVALPPLTITGAAGAPEVEVSPARIHTTSFDVGRQVVFESKAGALAFLASAPADSCELV